MGDLTRSYWGLRRGYHRLAPTTYDSRSKHMRWSWTRMPRRLKIKLRWNPKKLVARIYGAYVRMMIKLANSSVARGGAIAGYGAVGGAIYQFETMRPVREYNEMMIIELYKALAVRLDECLVALEVERPRIA